ncbi:TorD/DmsD family molecular chaperone [Sedimenticola sp.]|uniref:TorD/DmsD family molecular chaperone n=1 Tax=Sedimenticola sp. TaxID=1940285 RepID=UPI003D0E5B15
MQTTTTLASEAIMDNSLEHERVTETRAVAALFGFLARCLEEEVDAALIDLIRGELRGPLAMAGVVFDEEFHQTPTGPLVESLAEEYTGLFVAPGCISPYASVVETGCMFNEPADRAIAAYSQAGWDYRNRLSGEFPDHIGTMLGFYAKLANGEATALLAGDGVRAEQLSTQREAFLLEQLAEWSPGWCRRAAAAALLPFYKRLLEMAEQALWSELEQRVDRRRLRELAELNRREPKRLDYDADFRKASGL